MSSPRCLDRPVHPARHPGLHPLRQRPGVRRRSRPAMDRHGGSLDRLHRSGFALAERLHRELQCAASRRALGRRIFWEAQALIEAWRRHYSTIRPRGSLGYRPPTPETIVMPSRPPGSTPPVTQLGGETVNALTFKLDKSPGAGQRCLRKSVAVPVKRRTSRPRPSHAPGMARGSGPPNSSARGGAGSPNGPEWRVLDGRRCAFENTGATTARMIHRGSR